MGVSGARDLIVKGPTYFSPGDEKAFFDWLQAIPCVERVQGHVRDLHIKLKRPAGKSDLTELAALLKRYKIPTSGLAKLKTARNADWFATQGKIFRVGR
jgi:hypothetical protein